MPVLETVNRTTVEDFLAQPENSDWLELVDGEIVMSPRPRSEHQELIARLSYLFISRVGSSGRVVIEKEVVVRTPRGQEQVRVPDLCYVQETRQEIVAPEAIRGAPDIVVEILSEGTAEVDRITKRDEYRASGVAEYWIVDIASRSVLIHYFASGKQGRFEGDETFVSEVLRGLELPCEFSIAEIFEAIR